MMSKVLEILLTMWEKEKEIQRVSKVAQDNLKEQIELRMEHDGLTSVTAETETGGRWNVSMKTVKRETVTKLGRSYIKVHAAPESWPEYIKTTESKTTTIRRLG